MLKRRIEDTNGEFPLFLCHFDGTLNEQVKGYPYEFQKDESNNPTDSYFRHVSGKFGQGLSNPKNTAIINYYAPDINLSQKDRVTVECWYKIGSNPYENDTVRLGSRNTTYNYAQVGINFNYKNNLTILIGNSSGSGWSAIDQTGYQVSSGSFHHVALTILNKSQSSAEFKLYYDGNLIYNKTKTYYSNPGNYININIPNSGVIDELYIDGGIKYTDNFTPPNKPY